MVARHPALPDPHEARAGSRGRRRPELGGGDGRHEDDSGSEDTDDSNLNTHRRLSIWRPLGCAAALQELQEPGQGGRSRRNLAESAVLRRFSSQMRGR